LAVPPFYIINIEFQKKDWLSGLFSPRLFSLLRSSLFAPVQLSVLLFFHIGITLKKAKRFKIKKVSIDFRMGDSCRWRYLRY